MFLFYVLSFFKNGDTIQGGTLFKGEHYLRKYGISKSPFENSNSSIKIESKCGHHQKSEIYFQILTFQLLSLNLSTNTINLICKSILRKQYQLQRNSSKVTFSTEFGEPLGLSTNKQHQHKCVCVIQFQKQFIFCCSPVLELCGFFLSQKDSDSESQ